MKLFKFPVLNLIAIILLSASCSDETREVLTDEEVVIIMAASISEGTYGLVDQLLIAVELAVETSANPEFNCSMEQDSSIDVNSNMSSTESYSFEVDFDYELICAGLTPQDFEMKLETNGEFATPRVQFSGITEMHMMIDQLISGDTEYRVNGTFENEGRATVGNNNQNKVVSSTLFINNTNLKMDKTTYEITGGLSVFTMDVIGLYGDTEKRMGTINFSDNQTATIRFNEESYDIQL